MILINNNIGVTPRSAESALRTGAASGGGGAFIPNLLFLYRKTVNISRLGVQKASGGGGGGAAPKWL